MRERRARPARGRQCADLGHRGEGEVLRQLYRARRGQQGVDHAQLVEHTLAGAAGAQVSEQFGAP